MNRTKLQLFAMGWALFLTAGTGHAQLFENLRVLGGTRYPVSEPSLNVTNLDGELVQGPKDIAVADLDGDGWPDFMVSNKDGRVTVRYGLGDGKFGEASYLHTRTGPPLDLLRYAITNIYTNTYCDWQPTNFWITCYTNIIAGPPPAPPVSVTNVFCLTNSEYGCVGLITNFWTNTWVIEGPFGLRGLAVADFSGDGRPDIAVASPGEERIYLFLNAGSRQFIAPTNLPGWFGVRDLAAGDFDGDGRIDLAAAGTTNGLVQYRALGGGAFEVTATLTNFASDPFEDPEDFEFPQPAYYLKALRQPGDTRDELILSHAQRGKLWVLRAGLDGRLAITGDIENVSLTSLEAGPLLRPATNGAPPDLVTSYSRGGCVDVFPATNLTQRFSGRPAQRYFVPGGPRNVRIADLDGDGWNDLVVVAQLSDRVLTYHNNHGTLSLVAEAFAGRFPREMDLGDFNGDGLPDLAVLNRYSLDVSVLITTTNLQGNVGFLALDSVYPVDGGVSGLELRDFDGDQRPDVMQLHRDTAEFSVRHTGADGRLGPPDYFSITNLQPAAQVAVDVNNDGRPDMVAVGMSGTVTVRLGLTSGGFGPEMTYSLPASADGGLIAVTAADFDNDGFIDLAAAYWDCRVSFFQGTGGGHFVYTGTHPFIYEPRSMAAADLDQDGDIDLIGASLAGGFVVVENTGDLFTTTQLTKVMYGPTGYGASVRLVDQNGDGDPDVVMGAEGSLSLWLGGPGLSFVNFPTSNDPRLQGSTFVMADLDGDGDTDLATICSSNSCLTIQAYTNYQYITVLSVPVPVTRFLAAADLDGDGFTDLVGSGDVLWVALSSRQATNASPAQLLAARSARRIVINEVLPQNSDLPLAADGNRLSDWVELYNGGTALESLANWRLQLVRTNLVTLTTTNGIGGTNGLFVTNVLVILTNTYMFPPDASLGANSRRVLICTDRVRTPYHTGFNLPAEGALLVLRNAAGEEMDRVSYPAVGEDLAYARYSDGARVFSVNNIPSPDAPNVDNGAVEPVLQFDGVDLEALRLPGRPLRFRATARDDFAVINVSVLWRRLDVPDNVTKRVILYDDGMNDDGPMNDGVFSGVLPDFLPSGAEIQFYLECTDLSDVVVTTPGNPRFVSAGSRAQTHALAIGVPRPPLEISEIVANNVTGLADEQGGRADWVEIRNCSSNAVALGSVALSPKFFGDGSRMTFTNRNSILPGEHLVIYADNQPTQGQLHAPFRLDRLGEKLFLTGSTASGARYYIDALVYGPQGPDTAMARLGCGGPWLPSIPTPRAGNVATPWRAIVDGGEFLLAYPTRAGVTYTVEWKNNVTAPAWTAAPSVRSVGLEQTLRQPMTGARFYRVRED